MKVAVAALVVAAVTGAAHSQAGRVEEASFLRIGGIEQWVTIRGSDARKPILLLLHGGPGDVQSPYVTTYAPYERDFVLVQWDQRGSGETFARNGAAGVGLERLIAAGIDLAEQLRRRFDGQKLILFGHSWGSLLATRMAQQRPELFGAYVGTGQVSAWADTVRFQFVFLKSRYQERGEVKALEALQAIRKPDPNNWKEYFGWSRPIRQFLSPSDARWLSEMREVAAANGVTAARLEAIDGGMRASGAALGFADPAALPARFAMPCYVIQGRYDLFSPTALVEARFASISAPTKRLFVIESAGHFALATHQAEVIAALNEVIR